MARLRNIKSPLTSRTPSPSFNLGSASFLASFLLSPKNSPRSHSKLVTLPPATLFLLFLTLLVSFTFLGFFILSFIPFSQDSIPCSLLSPSSSLSSSSVSTSRLLFASLSSAVSSRVEDGGSGLVNSLMVPLPIQAVTGNVSKEEEEFWRQPDGQGYKPCLDFSIEYRKASATISKEKRRFLVVVVSGGLNQQRNQIIDAVVIARILGAALVVPVLQVNLIWGDESEFADIFDVEHFRRTLKSDVRIVSSLPSTHLMSRQTIESQIPRDISPLWLRTKYSRLLNDEGLLVLKGLDSKLSKNLPSDLQKLRCKVAFHALRFTAPIEAFGNRIARRMWVEGPYIALHLRLEKDVWVRSGCLTGLGPEYDRIINQIREAQPEYLTGRLNMSHHHRRLAGLCPLNALEISRLLKAMGAPSTARIYIAGGEPFGGTQALKPLMEEFQALVTREMLVREGELLPYLNSSSALAALDYIVSLNSNVFVPSHGGNMDRLMQGHRAYLGHRKYITPNKRAMSPLFEDSSISDAELGSLLRMLHNKSSTQPRTRKRNKDVTSYPVPECMCKNIKPIF
ncbi:hypothetical protein K2173_001088 [Erythroxylum novogranatense]|uniref:O-fucosyltransferase family protein n=1 Tax=Erythroxylum novogranatense TaxID=1862640 RepID=A0AAV8SIG3_9ROSI|nr:hypothetical protein K2173_001088 [Erythroxylum novogranatense]